MITLVVVLVAVVLAIALVIESLRWAFRPEARRLRTLKKLGGRR